MPGQIKTPAEIEVLAEGGQILRHILNATAKLAVPGRSTKELDDFAHKEILKAGGRPSFLGYGPAKHPFPASLCTSVNDVVVHGIPDKKVVLKAGDIVGLDIGMIYKGLYTDTAITVPVGEVSAAAKRLIDVTKLALMAGIKTAKAGAHTGDIGHAVQTLAEKNGFSVVRDLVGHGVGYAVHEDPQVPNYGRPGTGIKLVENMVIAIEPMLCSGKYHLYFDADNWTIRTEDGGLAAHFEHTIAITKKGPKILT